MSINFAHAPTAMLSLHVQNFVVIWFLYIEHVEWAKKNTPYFSDVQRVFQGSNRHHPHHQNLHCFLKGCTFAFYLKEIFNIMFPVHLIGLRERSNQLLDAASYDLPKPSKNQSFTYMRPNLVIIVSADVLGQVLLGNFCLSYLAVNILNPFCWSDDIGDINRKMLCHISQWPAS